MILDLGVRPVSSDRYTELRGKWYGEFSDSEVNPPDIEGQITLLREFNSPFRVFEYFRRFGEFKRVSYYNKRDGRLDNAYIHDLVNRRRRDRICQIINEQSGDGSENNLENLRRFYIEFKSSRMELKNVIGLAKKTKQGNYCIFSLHTHLSDISKFSRSVCLNGVRNTERGKLVAFLDRQCPFHM